MDLTDICCLTRSVTRATPYFASKDWVYAVLLVRGISSKSTERSEKNKSERRTPQESPGREIGEVPSWAVLLGPKTHLGAPHHLFGIARLLTEGLLARPIQTHVVGDLVQHVQSRRLLLHRERGQQQVVADGIDQARNSLCAEMDLF